MSRKKKTKQPALCDQPRVGLLDTFERVVHDYLVEYQSGAEREMQWYAKQPNLARVVEVAALSRLPSGKRHPHQRRIKASVLQEAKERLLRADLRSCQTFHELYEKVQEEIAGIRGAGELLVYDVAQRIGAYLGLKPERVYLHAGTRTGAKALGLYRGQAYLEPQELPEPFQQLSPAEMEDCLCLYKDELLKALSRSSTPPHARHAPQRSPSQ